MHWITVSLELFVEFRAVEETESNSSVGLTVGELFHHTEPCPSMMPCPLILIFVSFVNSIHWRRPDPQAWELVGAIILPSNCINDESTKLWLSRGIVY